jgi:EAL domain-containing protein (putative c-di-GMP-specific phosphodiesterase class I)
MQVHRLAFQNHVRPVQLSQPCLPHGRVSRHHRNQFSHELFLPACRQSDRLKFLLRRYHRQSVLQSQHLRAWNRRHRAARLPSSVDLPPQSQGHQVGS